MWIAVDPGGFVAATHGGYRFSSAAYKAWLARPDHALVGLSFPDLPCEPSLAPLDRQVRARQEQTLQWAWELWGGHDDTETWEVHRTDSWSYVPTVQGRTIGQTSTRGTIAPLLAQQFDHYHYTAYGRPGRRVQGDGDAQCNSNLGDSMLLQRYQGRRGPAVRPQPAIRSRAELGTCTSAAVAEVFPGRFHLWGVKLSCLRALARAGLMSRVAGASTPQHSTAPSAAGLGNSRRNRSAKLARSQLSASTLLTVALPRYARKVAGVLAQHPLW